ncbi:hypothetical protein RJ641_016991 [Dillenia turbinata]|uniref:Uncharacterized protein n=1 Tax=Dillenia turbinata TaxID=194707 RepID=A0AAN8YX99_9MAGN
MEPSDRAGDDIGRDRRGHRHRQLPLRREPERNGCASSNRGNGCKLSSGFISNHKGLRLKVGMVLDWFTPHILTSQIACLSDWLKSEQKKQTPPPTSYRRSVDCLFMKAITDNDHTHIEHKCRGREHLAEDISVIAFFPNISCYWWLEENEYVMLAKSEVKCLYIKT